MFEGESPPNYEQKCLCVFVLDISGSMSGEPIAQLNAGLKLFEQEVLEDFVASQRLEVAIVTFGSVASKIQDPALIGHFEMPKLTVSGSTKLVDGVRMGMDIIEERKQWYRNTGQNYFRPMLVLITDGEPDPGQDIDRLGKDVSSSLANKKFIFWTLGVAGYNHQKLLQICSTPPPLPLDGLKFKEFFTWLSNSIGVITNSQEGQEVKLADYSGWTQMKI